MKKIVFVCFLFMSMEFSLLFAARISGMDLKDIFYGNQLGLGYNSGELKTSLYSDFGTDFLRFSINILELGGSLLNNVGIQSNIYTNINYEGEYTPFVNGIPRFFIGTGFDTDYIKIAVGYGLKINRTNGYYNIASSGFKDDTGVDISSPRASFSVVGNSLYAHDISFYLQVPIDEYNSIEIASPIQFGIARKESHLLGDVYNKNGDLEGDFVFRYDNKNILSLCIAPQVVWNGYLGYLTRIRLIVPFSIYKAKELKLNDKDIALAASSVEGANEGRYDEVYDYIRGYTAKIPEKDNKAFGATLEFLFSFLEEDYVNVSFIPKFSFSYAISGNDLSTSTVMGKQSRDNDADISIDELIRGGYTLEEPWALKLSLPVRVSTEEDIVSVWTEPRFDIYFVDSIYTTKGQGLNLKKRDAPFFGLGYSLPIELTLKPTDSLYFNIGFEARGNTPLYGEPSVLSAKVDGSVIWYF